MISEDFRFEGFDTQSWLNLLSLFSAQAVEGTHNARPSTLVLVTSAEGAPCAGFTTHRGPIVIDAETRCGSPVELQELCKRWDAERAFIVDDGAIEELTERAATRVSLDDNYAAQWLALFGVFRELEDEGALRFWPARKRLGLQSAATLQRVLDLLLPDEQVVVGALWDGPSLWTACAIKRKQGEIESLLGPELLLDWAGPLSGDYRRDQRVLKRAVERSLGKVQLGIFAQRQRIATLLRDPSPGAWARAVALREVIIDPAPAYVHIAVAADAARAAGQRASVWLDALAKRLRR